MFESLIIRSVRNDKINIYDDTKNEWFDWLNDAHFLVQFFDVVCLKMPSNFRFWGSDRSTIPLHEIFLSLPPVWKSVFAHEAKDNFAYFVQRDQDGIIEKHFT